MLRKFTKSEGPADVLSPEAHKAIQTELNRVGKTSARDLSPSQRNSLQDAVDEGENH